MCFVLVLKISIIDLLLIQRNLFQALFIIKMQIAKDEQYPSIRRGGSTRTRVERGNLYSGGGQPVDFT